MRFSSAVHNDGRRRTWMPMVWQHDGADALAATEMQMERRGDQCTPGQRPGYGGNEVVQ